MLGVPEWAIGIGVIVLFMSARLLMLAWLHPRNRGVASRFGPATDAGERDQEIEELTQRVNELEERVDFRERVLAKQREGQSLAPPKD